MLVLINLVWFLKLNIHGKKKGKECVIAYVYVTRIRGVELRAPNNWGCSQLSMWMIMNPSTLFFNVFLLGQYNFEIFFLANGWAMSKRFFFRGKVREI